MGRKARQNFQCRITIDEEVGLIKAFNSHGFNSNSEFLNTFVGMLNSGDITGHLRSFRVREVDNR